MGQYLEDSYAERDLAKALAKAHGLIDEETRKLSDKLKNLTLSHNRKKKALKDIIFLIDNDSPGYNPNSMFYMDLLVRIRRLCNNVLFSDGRSEIK